jgi:hypothetical protein
MWPTTPSVLLIARAPLASVTPRPLHLNPSHLRCPRRVEQTPVPHHLWISHNLRPHRGPSCSPPGLTRPSLCRPSPLGWNNLPLKREQQDRRHMLRFCPRYGSLSAIIHPSMMAVADTTPLRSSFAAVQFTFRLSRTLEIYMAELATTLLDRDTGHWWSS